MRIYQMMYNDGTMLSLPPRLRDIDPDYLVDGLAQMPSLQFVRNITILIYKRYGNRRIGTMSRDEFRNWFQETWVTQWRFKYAKIYDSIDAVKNPFISVWLGKQDRSETSKQAVMYGDYRNADFGNTVGAGNTKGAVKSDSKKADNTFNSERAQNAGTSANTEASSARSNEANNDYKSGRNQGALRDSSIQDNSGRDFKTSTTNKKFANTPQELLDGKEPSVGDDGGKTGMWNGGFITTIAQDTTSEYGKNESAIGSDKINENDQRTDEKGGSWGNKSSDGFQGSDGFTTDDHRADSKGGSWGNQAANEYNEGNTQHKEATQSTGHSNTNQRTGSAHVETGRWDKKGLEGFLVSEALAKWRETFLPVDNMFVGEFSGLFFGVMNNDF